MRNSSSERPVVPSIIDRLVDDEPNIRHDAPVTRNESIQQLKISLQRDLEWLLNTRRIPEPLPREGAEELENSLYNYGLPEFPSLTREGAARLLEKHIQSALEIFEPRLASIHVEAQEYKGEERIARFVIDAILLINPMPERVTFDTVLELTSGEYRVRGDSRA